VMAPGAQRLVQDKTRAAGRLANPEGALPGQAGAVALELGEIMRQTVHAGGRGGASAGRTAIVTESLRTSRPR
jgi:hypothetical protein